MDAIYFTLLFKALVMGGGVHKYISMTPLYAKVPSGRDIGTDAPFSCPVHLENCPCYALAEGKGAALILENFAFIKN